jgi:hypothetical protein
MTEGPPQKLEAVNQVFVRFAIVATLPNGDVAGSLEGHEPATGRSAVGSGKGEAAAVRQCADAAEGLSGPRSALNRHLGRRGEISTGILPTTPAAQSMSRSPTTETMTPLWRYRGEVCPWTTERPNSKPQFAPKMR